MSNTDNSMGAESKNDSAWQLLFDKYSILDWVEKQGFYKISASQIKEFREPRLMAKFDHTINLPKLFKQNNLAILPVTRGDYVISKFNAYHKFETLSDEIVRVNIPSYIQSLSVDSITSEAVALNCAFISVSIIPGAIQFTWILDNSISLANAFVKPITPAFAVE